MEDEHVFFRFFTALRRKWLWVLLALSGAALVVVGGLIADRRTTTAETAADEPFGEAYRVSLEQEITEMVRALDGVGQARVMVTLSEGESYTYSGSRVTSTEMPKVCGIAVLCDGGADPAVQAEVVRLLTALFSVGAHRVYVGPLVS